MREREGTGERAFGARFDLIALFPSNPASWALLPPWALPLPSWLLPPPPPSPPP